MYSTRFLCFLVVLVAVTAAADEVKCAKQLNVEESDWVEFKKDQTHAPEKILCFFKCEYTKSGVFNEDKTVNADKLIGHVEKWRKLKDTTKAEIKECVQKLTTPVNSCADINPFHLCVHTAVHKELNGKTK